MKLSGWPVVCLALLGFIHMGTQTEAGGGGGFTPVLCLQPVSRPTPLPRQDTCAPFLRLPGVPFLLPAGFPSPEKPVTLNLSCLQQPLRSL